MSHPSLDRLQTSRDLLDEFAEHAGARKPCSSTDYPCKDAPSSAVDSWRPISTKRTSLAGFAIAFVILDLILALLTVLSRRTNGFTVVLDNHYLWTYGPTAVLIVIISLWRQVDYGCKILIPWNELEAGSKPASKTVLLDYVSPFQLVTLVRAARNGHAVVTLTTLGFFILKIITIASTGLFVVNEIQAESTRNDLTTTTTFHYPRIGNSISSNNATSLAYQAYGYLVNGMPFVDGVTADTAYQSVALPNSQEFPNITYSANVQAIKPSFDCQRVSVNLELVDPAADDTELAFRFSTPAPCNFTQQESGFCYPAAVRCPPSELRFVHEVTDCGYPDQTWWFISYGRFIYNQTLDDADEVEPIGTSVNASDWSIQGTDDSSWICKVEYSMQTIEAVYDTKETPSTIKLNALDQSATNSLPGFTSANLSTETINALNNAPEMFLGQNPFLNMIQRVANATNETFLLNPDSMGSPAETVFRQLAAQVISQTAMQNTINTVSGVVSMQQTRLQINTTALIIMITGFTLMVLVTGLVAWLRPISIKQSGRPDTIKSILSLIGQSENLRQLISRCHTMSEKTGATQLHQFLYSSRLEWGYNTNKLAVDVIREKTDQNLPVTNNLVQRSWYRPFTLRTPLIVLSVLTPPVLIVVLEILQQLSDRRNGFVEINPGAGEFVESIYSRFIPATIMLLVATLYSSLDFNAASLAPYNSLASNHQNSHQVISSSLLAKLPPIALLSALHHKQWSAAFAATAAFIGSILTIIVSGLFIIDLVPTSRQISLQRQDTFQLLWNNSVYDDGGAAVLLSLIESSNLTYPMLTYDELALPNLTEAIVTRNSPAPETGTLQMNVPALRGNLQCNESLSDNWTFSYLSQIDNWELVAETSWLLPAECLYGGPGGNESTLDFSHSWQIPSKGTRVHTAQLLDLHVGPYDVLEGASSDENFPDQNADNPTGCPSIAFSWAYGDTARNQSGGQRTFVCNQQIQQVETLLTLNYPEMTISEAHPPIPNEQNVVILSAGPNNSTNFEYRIQNPLKAFSSFNRAITFTSPIQNNDELQLDSFFSGVLSTSNYFDIAEYPSVDNDQMLAGIQSFYRRYMAQVINIKMRTPIQNQQVLRRNTDSNSDTYDATLTPNVGFPRLKQHKPSKLVLQIMLAAMFICGIISLSLGRYRKVVLWDPSTIAGMAVLLAGSKLCIRQQGGVTGIANGSKPIAESTPLMSEALPDLHQSEDQIPTSHWGEFSSQSRNARIRNQSLDITPTLSDQYQKNDYQDQTASSINIRNVRLRLGWWRNGEFLGTEGPTAREMELDVKAQDQMDMNDHLRVSGNENIDEDHNDVANSRGRLKVRWRYGIDVEESRPCRWCGKRDDGC